MGYLSGVRPAGAAVIGLVCALPDRVTLSVPSLSQGYQVAIKKGWNLSALCFIYIVLVGPVGLEPTTKGL